MALAFVTILFAAGETGLLTPAVIVAVIAAVAAVAGGYLSYRAATKANTVSSRKVDLDEYEAQKVRYRDMIAEQDRHIERIRHQLERVQDQLAKEQDVSAALRSEIRALQGQVDLLTASRRSHGPMP